MKKKPKRRPSLKEKQRRFVLNQKSSFKPVRPEEYCEVGNVQQILMPIVHYLNNFREYRSLGAELPSGALFYGPPGTGKTYTARFLATSTSAGFVDVRGFPCIQRDDDTFPKEDIRSLFAYAAAYVRKKNKPIVLFWDQFDAFLEDASKEAVNQLNMELDGINGKNSGVFLVAATADDPHEDEDKFSAQLLRKGRLGILAEFTHPTKKQLAGLLQSYLDKRPHEFIDVESVAHLIVDSAPATVLDLVELAYRQACLRVISSAEKSAVFVTEKDILEALVSHLQGCSLRIDLSEEERDRIALHEVGHAVVAHTLGRPVQMISLLPASDAHGKVYYALPWGHPENAKEIKNEIAVGIAGLVAEELFAFTPGGFGACGDLKKHSELAKEFVAAAGKGPRLRRRYGPISIDTDKEKLVASQRLLRTLEADVGELLKQEEKRARKILTNFGKERLRHIAREILKKDPPIILQEEFQRLILASEELEGKE